MDDLQNGNIPKIIYNASSKWWNVSYDGTLTNPAWRYEPYSLSWSRKQPQNMNATMMLVFVNTLVPSLYEGEDYYVHKLVFHSLRGKSIPFD